VTIKDILDDIPAGNDHKIKNLSTDYEFFYPSIISREF